MDLRQQNTHGHRTLSAYPKRLECLTIWRFQIIITIVLLIIIIMILIIIIIIIIIVIINGSTISSVISKTTEDLASAKLRLAYRAHDPINLTGLNQIIFFTGNIVFLIKRKINDKKETRRFDDSCHHYQMRRKLA